jgi:hypothetical protein
MRFTWPAFLKLFPPLGLDVHHAAARPLSQVSLRLINPNGFPDILPKLHQIQQSNIQLIVADLRGNNMLQFKTPGNA